MLRTLLPVLPGHIHLDRKRTIFSLRGVISLLMLFFLLYHPASDQGPRWTAAVLFAGHLISNLLLLRMPCAWLERASVQAGVFLFDILVISGLIFACAGLDSDLYLVYFVVVLMSGLQMRVWQSLLIGAAASAVYVTLWTRSNPGADLWHADLLLRLPFFYIVAVFAAFFAQQAKDRESAIKEESIQEERSKLRAVFGQMQDAAVLTDAPGKVVLHNEAAARLFGISDPRAGTLADHLLGLSVDPPVPAILDSSEATVCFEVTRSSPTKLILAGTATALAFEEAAERPAWLGRLFVFRDVTTERQEGLLKRSFLFLIQHKLRTPLALVIGFSQMLLKRRGSASVAEAGQDEKALDTILSQSRKLNDLVDRLLDFVSVEALDPASLERKAFPLAEAIRDAVKPLEAWMGERDAVLDLAVDPALTAYGDQKLISRVFRNLIENGVKFNSKPEKRVTVRACARDGGIAASVEDQGDGIPPEDRDRIFQRFHQVEPSFTGNVEGWGLGLPMARKVVEHHGGRLAVESSLGNGTTVSFTFPKPPPLPAD
ncbi:MAG: PAS domain-containing protein [Elusimicrobia bacterium]|nr:PAS domain-containing protein [Elusimicrobiota bacterium]